MSNPTYYLKAGDRLDPIEGVLSDANGAVNLTGRSVTFIMRRRSAFNPKVEAAATIVGVATAGAVRYDWQAGDTNTPGTYDAHFVVDNAGKLATFPRPGYIKIVIEDDLT